MANEAIDFEVLESRPQLSTAPLRHIPETLATASRSRINEHTAELQLALVADERIYISPAQIDGDTWLRPCFTNFRTTNADVLAAFDVIREVSNSLANG
jgi:aromatic-L-amino-acid decarboxylase